MNVRHVLSIIRKDYAIDMRQIHAVAGVLLFAVTCSYLIYRTFGTDISKQVWNIMLWLLILFVGINATVKSFNQESKGTYLYYYTLFAPMEVLVARLIYNTVFLGSLLLILILVFTILFQNPIIDYGLFVSGALGGIVGISAIFTFVSIVAAGENGNTVMSVLSLPLVIPILMLLVKITSVSMGLMTDTSIYDDVWLIYGVDILLIGVIIIIFPSLWRA